MDTILVKKATFSDCKLVFDLSNDEDVRKVSFDSRPIFYSEHEKWFYQKINDENVLFLLFFIKESFIGQIRYECRNESAFISISIEKCFRGKNFSNKILELSHKYLHEHFPDVKCIIAHIREDNIASIKLFSRLHYKKNKDLIINQINSVEYIFLFKL